MAMPKFIELPGSSTLPLPYRMTGVNEQMFVLPASYDRLVQVTDNWLNSGPPSEYRFVPLLPFVVCNPLWIDQIRWTPDDGHGYIRESDFAFGFFVACFRGVEFDHIAVAMAYLVVDNPLACSTGREVLGFRKVFGTMEYVAGTYQPGAAFTWVFKKYAPDQEYEVAEVARVVPPQGWASATRHAEWEDLKTVVEVAAGDLALDAATAVSRLVELFKTQSLSVVYLLELRDVEDPTSAAYQALIEAPFQITRINFVWALPPGFRIKLTDYPSYPLISDLGIKVDADNYAESVLSFQLNYDCVFQKGKVLAVGGRTTPSS